MKPNDVRRGIASRHLRTGSGPDIGRVSKMRGPNAPSTLDGDRVRRRSSRSGASASRHRMVKLWSIALGVAAFAIVIIAFGIWLRPMVFPDFVPVGTTAEDLEKEVKIASRFPSPSRDESIALVKSALANRDLEKVAFLFRTGTATPSQILDYCSHASDRDGPVEDYDWMSSLDTDGLLIEGVLVHYQGTEKPVQRLALLTPDDRGRWQLDFDAFARTVTPPWTEILAGGGDQARVRVMVQPGVYYNGPFQDESIWSSYSLTSPDMDSTLCGYCRIGSPEAQALRKLFADGTSSTRASLDIRRVKDGEPLQFEITRLLALEWLIPADGGNALEPFPK